MAYTYTDNPVSGGTAQQQSDAVRVLIQDTLTAAGANGGKFCTDAQIAFAIAEEMNVYMAAARLAELLGAASGNVATRRVGDVSITYDPKIYRDLAVLLRARGMAHQALYAGGQSVADKQTDRDDTDVVQPSFAIDDFEFKGAGMMVDERQS